MGAGHIWGLYKEGVTVRGYADNALMAKARALYGTRLRDEDYAKLLAAKSVPEVAAYLKSNTAYGSILAEVMEELVHRGQLEDMVRRRSLGIYSSLLHYSHGDRLFLKMYTMENEIKQLLLAIRFLNANSMDRYIVALPVYLARFTSFDLFALAGIKSYDGLMDAVKDTPYYSIITRFRPITSDRRTDITGCEKALLEHFYSFMLDTVRKNYRGNTRDSLERLLFARVVFHNISVAYRLKRYFGYPAGRIRDSMLDIKTGIAPRAYEGVINAQGDAELSKAMGELRVIKKLLPGWDDTAQELSVNLSRAQSNMSRREFRFSTMPMVVVINYMLLLEIEVGNIVNIIEGVRYQVPTEEIRALLVI